MVVNPSKSMEQRNIIVYLPLPAEHCNLIGRDKGLRVMFVYSYGFKNELWIFRTSGGRSLWKEDSHFIEDCLLRNHFS